MQTSRFPGFVKVYFLASWRTPPFPALACVPVSEYALAVGYALASEYGRASGYAPALACVPASEYDRALGFRWVGSVHVAGTGSRFR